MLVRVCVKLEPDSVAKLVHATPHEPCFINREQGKLGFILPQNKIEAILKELSETDLCSFEAYVIGPALKSRPTRNTMKGTTMKPQRKRENDREAVLEKVRNNPGITAADIPVKQRGQLRGLERDGLIECRGYGWYARQSHTGNDTDKDDNPKCSAGEQEQATFVIAVGNPFDGIQLYGQSDGMPFPSHDDAAEHAERSFDNSGGWWIVPIQSGRMKHP